MKTLTPVFVSFTLILFFGCKSTNPVDSVAQELHNYRILFARNTTELNRPGGTGSSIYVVRADGSELQDLSRYPAGWYGHDAAPQFSPNGNSIAFQSNRVGGQEIFVMHSDGTNLTNITNESDLDLEFDWSPDGTKLAFTRLFQNHYVIYTISAGGTNLNPLTSASDNCRYPAWSPGVTKIVFSQFDSTLSKWRVFVMDSDGSNPQPISDSTDSSVFPQWSPDGQRVYYMVQGFGVKLRSLDGSYSSSLAGFFPRELSWSPNRQTFLVSDTVGIASASADLSSFGRLGIQGYEPKYSPDGQWILFLRANNNGLSELHVARSNGADERTVIPSQYGDQFASWWP